MTTCERTPVALIRDLSWVSWRTLQDSEERGIPLSSSDTSSMHLAFTVTRMEQCIPSSRRASPMRSRTPVRKLLRLLCEKLRYIAHASLVYYGAHGAACCFLAMRIATASTNFLTEAPATAMCEGDLDPSPSRSPFTCAHCMHCSRASARNRACPPKDRAHPYLPPTRLRYSASGIGLLRVCTHSPTPLPCYTIRRNAMPSSPTLHLPSLPSTMTRPSRRKQAFTNRVAIIYHTSESSGVPSRTIRHPATRMFASSQRTSYRGTL